MGIPFDLKLDANNDLILSKGDLQLTTKRSEICKQSLGITLKTWKGEWFLDTDFGVPYLQEIIGVARKKEIIDKIFLSYIADNEYVDSIKSYSSTEDRSGRYYSATFTITCGEETVTSSFSTQPSEEYIYPTPDEDFTITCEEYQIAPYAEQLYYYENREGLPPFTFDTWWNTWNGQESSEFTMLTTASGETITTASGETITVRTS